jgi:hypothetical protein
MFVFYTCCVLWDGGLCDELITRPEESHRQWCVVVCDLETSWMRRPWANWGAVAPKIIMECYALSSVTAPEISKECSVIRNPKIAECLTPKLKRLFPFETPVSVHVIRQKPWNVSNSAVRNPKANFQHVKALWIEALCMNW